MKKRYLLLITCLCVLALAGGCKKRNTIDNLPQGNTSTSNETEDFPVKESYKASDYVTLGQYKGIEVTVERIKVTDRIVEMMIQNHLASNATLEEVTDRAVMEGDTVNIDFEGLKDGVAFEGGTAQGYEIVIGSGQLIPGFEEGLIGANKGDKLSLDLTFPENYSNSPELAGQPVVFNVTVNSISASKIPELTDEYVKEYTEYDTVAVFREESKKQLQEISDETFESERMKNVLQALIDSSTFSSIPQNLIDYYSYSYKTYLEQQAYYTYGVALADYLAYIGMSDAEFEDVVKQVAENQAKSEMVELAVAEAEGITISDAEYKELLTEYMSARGVDKEETLRQFETKEQTLDNMRMQKAVDLIISSAVIKEEILDEYSLGDSLGDTIDGE